ncbi:MAG: glycosyltransferase family 4 protein [Prolixibacteraceae bacterium]
MKIIHVTDTSIYNFDGISTYINELLVVGEKIGDETLVLTTTPIGNVQRNYHNYSGLKLKSFKSAHFPYKPKFVVVSPLGMDKIITDFHPDLVWIHTIGTLGLRAAALSANKYPIIYTKHCFDGELWNAYLNIPRNLKWTLYKASELIENRILEKCDKVIYHINDDMKIMNSKYFSKFEHIPPPLNARFFQNRLTIPKNNRRLTIGFSGRAEPDKGIEHTFRGLKILMEKYEFNNFEFLFIGDGTEAHRMKLKYPEMDIRITGYLDDVIPALDTLDAFVLSSLQETISLSSLEAYARGIPIFSVPIGYLYEHHEKLNNYFLFETAEQLADLLFEKLVKDHQKEENSNLQNIDDFIISYEQLFMIANHYQIFLRWGSC